MLPLVGSRIVRLPLSFAVGLRPLVHLQADTVLDAAGGVGPLQLGENPHVRLGAHVLQFHRRRVADGVEDTLVCQFSDHLNPSGSGPEFNSPSRKEGALRKSAVRGLVVGCADGGGFLVGSGHAAEHFVVDEFRDGGVVAAQGALGVPLEANLAEAHVQRVDDQQAGD